MHSTEKILCQESPYQGGLLCSPYFCLCPRTGRNGGEKGQQKKKAYNYSKTNVPVFEIHTKIGPKSKETTKENLGLLTSTPP